MVKHKLPPREIQEVIHNLYTDCIKEDEAVRMRQLRSWRRLKLLWEGYQRVWFDEVAHDWRIWDYVEQSNSDQAYYDKEVNIFKAYLESIIAALSVTVPGVKCFPDDADQSIDLATAKAGDRLARLIYRHNSAPLLWLKGLFIFCTEGMTAFYNYVDKDKSYGTYETKEYEDQDEQHSVSSCPNCNFTLDTQPIDPNNPIPPSSNPNPVTPPVQDIQNGEQDKEDEYDPSLDGEDQIDQEECPSCGSMMTPQMNQETITVTRLVGITKEAKSRICIEVCGGLNVRVPNYARCQAEVGYLIKSEELDYHIALEEYDHLEGDKVYEDLKAGKNILGGYDSYEMMMRLSPQYMGEFPMNIVTVNTAWIRPARFNSLEPELRKRMRKKYPNGVKAVFINQELVCAYDECLDDHWTLLKNPTSDYIHFNPLGQTLTSIQEITNDLVSLVLQTIEHGIGQTVADPAVFDFKAYAQTEVLPGSIMPSKSTGNKRLNESIFEFKTATLSGEILPFYQQVQGMGQMTSGALPSLFGGAMEGSGQTASQYSMSRSQALQRLQNSWKMFCYTWKDVFGKVIPAYIKVVQEEGDVKDVEKTKDNNFVNTFIRRAELDGELGKIELEASENLPQSAGQIQDLLKELLLNQNPLIQTVLTQPENIPIIQESLGLPDLFVPGEQDVENQYEEIKLMLQSEPIPTGDPEVPATPAVEIDPDFDNHKIHFEICRKWIISDAGRNAKIDNPPGYQNVILHAKAHLSTMQQAAMQQSQMAAGPTNGAPPAKPNPNDTKEAPITGSSDVQAQV